MPRGGRRAGAGRPRGAKGIVPPRKRIKAALAPSVAALLDYAKTNTDDGSLVAVLETFRTSTDREDRKWWAGVVLSYGVGLPAKRQEAGVPDAGRVFDEATLLAAARTYLERRQGLPQEARLLPSSPAEQEPLEHEAELEAAKAKDA